MFVFLSRSSNWVLSCTLPSRIRDEIAEELSGLDDKLGNSWRKPSSKMLAWSLVSQPVVFFYLSLWWYFFFDRDVKLSSISHTLPATIRDEIAEELSRLDEKLGNSCSGGSHPLESCLKYNLITCCVSFLGSLCLGQPSAIEALPIPLMFSQEHWRVALAYKEVVVLGLFSLSFFLSALQLIKERHQIIQGGFFLRVSPRMDGSGST